MRRRKFIQTTAAAAVSMLAMPSCDFAGWGSKVGIQLYTLKDVINDDPKGILKQLASFGYKELETFGYSDGKLFGLTVDDYGKEVEALGMQTVSGHFAIDLVRNDWERTVADAKKLGQSYACVPWLPEQDRTLDGIKAVCETINNGAEVCRQYDMKIGYHNHDFEFKDGGDGKLLYDVMLEELDPKLVSMEMDLYWVVAAGYDPLAYFEKYPGRFEQWHVKDRDKEVPTRNTEVGNGSIDFKSIFAQAKQSGMKHLYIEQEYFAMPSIESARIGIENLQQIL